MMDFFHNLTKNEAASPADVEDNMEKPSGPWFSVQEVLSQAEVLDNLTSSPFTLSELYSR